MLTESNIKQEIEQSRVEQAALLGEKENPVLEEAEFHQRGALSRHHAQPLSSDHGSSLREVTLPHSTPTHIAGEGHGGGHAPSGTGGSGSLLEGTFNEDQSTASFQEALMAWRTGGSGGEPNQEEEELREEKGDAPSTGIWLSSSLQVYADLIST